MDTSVIIPCHNAEQTLGLQLESLARQQGATPFEVVVVDNCSTDGTVAVAESFAKVLELRVVAATEHAGVSYARNVGGREAAGEKLIFLDADDAVPTEYVSYSQRSLDKYPVYVGGFDPVDAREFGEGLEHVLSLIAHRTLPYADPLPSEVDPRWPILPGCSFGMLKQTYLEIGGFDLWAEPGAEDNDLGIRLVEAGYELRVQRSTTIAYRVVDGGKRPFHQYRRRAMSIALVLTSYNRWAEPAATGISNPLKSLARTLLAGAKVLATNRAAWGEWTSRLATDLGLAQGFVLYQVLHRIPPRRLGEGL